MVNGGTIDNPSNYARIRISYPRPDSDSRLPKERDAMNTQSSKQEARERVLELVKPGDTVYTILRHVSRSGMSRIIDLVIMQDGEPQSISGMSYKILDSPLDRDRWGVKVGGTGMDMGFAVVYDLSYRLFPEGFGCTGERCPSNDHSNGDRDYTPHGHRPPVYTGDKSDLIHWHKDGGYALRQRWM